LSVIRPLEPGDAGPLARLFAANREFMAPFEPPRPEGYYTESVQAERIADLLVRTAEDHVYGFVVLDQGEIAGRITLSEVVRGPLQSANVGYWIDQGRNGRGLATRALAALLETAFGELGLHRVGACTRLENHASQRVLAKNGFTRIGIARRHLFVGGEWRDQILFERLADD
jgi:[ribosomal protein S5]-alanine N-acetyltransferase